jgi:hypothetical protein
MRTTYKNLSLAAAMALMLPLAALAQSARDVRIVVKDLSSDQEIGSILPGGSFTLQEGQRVRLIMTAQGRGRTLYPQTEFSENEPGRGWVKVTRTNVENANATLEAVRPSNTNRNRVETLRYRITEDLGLPNDVRQGTVTIRVEPVSAQGNSPLPTTGNTRASQLTNVLYRGILMRDMDQAGAQTFINSIANGGYNELVFVAQQIAQSEESRIRLYEQGQNNQQRLTSLYQHLLGMSSNQIDSAQWDADLRRLNDGKIVDVVLDMVRSERFQDYHNVDERTAIRY